MEEVTKKCIKCESLYPATKEYFHKHSGFKDGLLSTCKVCKNKNACLKGIHINWQEVKKVNLFQCRMCGIEKEFNTNFRKFKRKDRSNITYLTVCNKCESERLGRKQRNESIKERARIIANHIRGRIKNTALISEIDRYWIEEKWKEQNGLCYYTGKPMSLKTGDSDLVSVDRINSDKGYTKDNSVLCRWVVNNIKQKYDLEDLEIIFKDFLSYYFKIE